MAARALFCAVLASGQSRLQGLPPADDVHLLIRALRALGYRIEGDPPDEVHVWGAGGSVPAAEADLHLGNAGTPVRFLLPLLALGRGVYRVDGEPRMRERPVAGLLAALQLLGVDAWSETGSGCPPVRVRGGGLQGGELRVPAAVSSQYLSALLLAAPAMPRGLILSTGPDAVSLPYVELTLHVMRDFGVEIGRTGDGAWQVAPGGGYRAREYKVEADASGAGYLWAVAAAAGGTVRVEGLPAGSLQPDLVFLDLLRSMGLRVEARDDGVAVSGDGGPLRAVDADMAGCPDLVPTVAALGLLAEGETVIRGVPHLRYKESDRIAVTAAAVRALGGEASERPDGLCVRPGTFRGGLVATAGDHRLAMAFCLPGLRYAGVRIADPDCVSKSFPGFWEILESLRPGA